MIKNWSSILLTKNINATRSVSIAFGLMASITGIIYGLFEVLQGNNATAGFKISAIGQGYSMWEDPAYASYSFIDNYLYTGITAILFSVLVTIWVLFFIHKKYGSAVMLLLSFGQFFTGGGIAIDVAVLSAIIATQINRPLIWWSKIMPEKFQNIFICIWPWAFIIFILLSLANFILIVSGVNSSNAQQTILVIAGILFFPIIFTVLGGFSFDRQKLIQ